jgi:hypothetical protein
MADVAIELIPVRLAQDSLLVGLRELAEEKHIRRRAADVPHGLSAVASLDGIRLRLLDRLRVAAAGAPQLPDAPAAGRHLRYGPGAVIWHSKVRKFCTGFLHQKSTTTSKAQSWFESCAAAQVETDFLVLAAQKANKVSAVT